MKNTKGADKREVGNIAELVKFPLQLRDGIVWAGDSDMLFSVGSRIDQPHVQERLLRYATSAVEILNGAAEKENLIEEILNRLFTNGIGEKAKRLVLELEDGRDGGGWCMDAARDQIREVLQPPAFQVVPHGDLTVWLKSELDGVNSSCDLSHDFVENLKRRLTDENRKNRV